MTSYPYVIGSISAVEYLNSKYRNDYLCQITRGYSSYSKKAGSPYYWELNVSNGLVYFEFGCESHELKSWTPRKIRDLCKKHKELKLKDEINMLVRLAKGKAESLSISYR